jgi:hypothetical protein
MPEKRLQKNIIQPTSDGDLLSNYLLALGKSEVIDIIKENFNDGNEENTETSIVNIRSGFTLLSVSKSECLQEIKNSVVFFRGWFQDHHSQSIVLGQNGFSEWLKGNQEKMKNEYEGSYISAIYNNEKMIIRNDLFSYLPVIYFMNENLFVCSDSMYIISEIRKMLNLECKLNKKVVHSRAWTHGLACAPMSNESQIQDVYLLSTGKSIEIGINKKRFHSKHILSSKNIVKHSNLKQKFDVQFDNYKDAIRSATQKMAHSTMSLLHLDDVLIKFGLSGGLDSRIILAAILQKPELLGNIAITTNEHPSRKGDFDVVEKLANQFGFEFNNNEKLSLHKKKHSLVTEKTEDRFALWVLSSMGLFDMMYIHDSYWPIPHIIDMGGHGAESIKGTFSPMKFEDYIKPKKVSTKAKFSRKGLRYMREAKEANIVHDSIRSELSSALATSGIDLDEFASIQWHYLSYKSPIANGRFLDCSSIGIRPFIQHNLFALSVSEINPFKQAKRGEPTMLHDMLILLYPELAAVGFENEKSNVSEEYIQSRLEALGGRLQLSESEPYAIYGKISDLRNGPPTAFLNMVKHDFGPDDNDMKSIHGALERTWSKISNKEVKAAYQTAYDTAIERLTDPDYYPPSAGTPAAKIISLSLLDSIS